MIAGIILAAGSAKRMGSCKQLLPLADKTIVWQVANTACQSKIDHVIFVTGAYQDQVAAAVQGLNLTVIHNPKWSEGQAGSLTTGLLAMPENIDAVIFLLADQPLLTPEVIDALIDRYHGCDQSIICPAYKNSRGNPVLFDWKTWKNALLSLQGDSGARRIIADNPESVALVPIDSGDIFCDVDTEEDYKKMCDLFRKQAKSLEKF